MRSSLLRLLTEAKSTRERVVFDWSGSIRVVTS